MRDQDDDEAVREIGVGVAGLGDRRSTTGVGPAPRTRLGAKVAAHNFILFVNHLTGRPPFSPFSPLG